MEKAALCESLHPDSGSFPSYYWWGRGLRGEGGTGIRGETDAQEEPALGFKPLCMSSGLDLSF